MREKTTAYYFTDSEIKEMALFFRACDRRIPKSLEALAKFTEDYVYASMTVYEAEEFFCNPK